MTTQRTMSQRMIRRLDVLLGMKRQQSFCLKYQLHGWNLLPQVVLMCRLLYDFCSVVKLGEGKLWFQTGGLWTPAQPLQASPDRRRETLIPNSHGTGQQLSHYTHSWRSVHSIWPNGFCGEYTGPVLEHPGRGLWDCTCVGLANHQVYQLRGPLAPPLHLWLLHIRVQLRTGSE